MNDQALYELVKAVVAKTMRLEARCDALEIAVGLLAKKTGLSEEELLKYVDQLTELSFQKRLERAEGINPELAAEIDYRPELPELPDWLVDS